MKNFNVKQSGSEVKLEEITNCKEERCLVHPCDGKCNKLILTSIDPNIKVGEVIMEDQLEYEYQIKFKRMNGFVWETVDIGEFHLYSYEGSHWENRQVAKLKQPVHETPKSDHVNGTGTKKEESDHDLESNDMIEELKKQAKSVSLNSKEYWQLKAEYLQKYIDPTYSKQERRNCLMFWKILDRRTS